MMGTCSICPFCYKSKQGLGRYHDSEDLKQKRKLLLCNFSKTMQRCFGTSVIVSPTKLLSISQEKVGCCEDCLIILETICNLHHEIRCLELRRDWKVQSLANIVKEADKVKSRKHLVKVTLEDCENGQAKATDSHSHINESNNGKEVYKLVRTFRKDFLKMCSRHFVNSNPRVILKRKNVDMNEDMTRKNGSSWEPENKCVPVNLTPCVSPVTENKLSRVFLGWTLSFSLVLMLGWETTSTPARNLIPCLSNDLELDLEVETENRNCEVGETTPTTTIAISTESQDDGLLFSTESLTKYENTMIPNTEEKAVSTCFPHDDDMNDDNFSLLNYDQDSEVEFNGPTVQDDVINLPTDGLETADNVTEKQVDKKHTPLPLPLVPIPSHSSEIIHPQEQCNITEENNASVSNTGNLKQECNARVNIRYNLRTVRKSGTLNKVNDGDGIDDSDEEYLKDSDNNSSSETSDDALSSDTEFHANRKESSGFDKTFKIKDKLKAWLRKKLSGRYSKDEGRDVNENDSKPLLPDIASCNTSAGESKYICSNENCKEEFANAKEFKFHLKLHGIFACNFCNGIERFAPDLCIHEEKHSVRENKMEGYYYCPRCPYQIAGVKSLYISHHLEAHLNIKRSRFDRWECPICKSYLSEAYKEKHFTINHDTRGVDPSAVYKCDVDDCPAYFTKKHKFHSHMLEIHEKDYIQLQDGETSNADPSFNCEDASTVPQTYFECKLCRKKFKLQSWLTQHEKIFHKLKKNNQGRKFKRQLGCPVSKCPEKFTSKEELEKHGKLHGKFKCKFCDVEKDYAPEISLHEIEHSIGNPNEIVNGTNEKNQSSSCEPISQYKCPRCNYTGSSKGFYINHHLVKHLNISSRTASCDICGTELGSRHKLRHFLTHHNTEGADPNDIQRCDKCPAYFLLGIQLVAHKKKMHSSLNCVHCGKLYKNNKSLQSHVRLMHRDMAELNLPEACDVPNCGRTFATKAELEWHTTYNHIYHIS